MRVIVVVLLLTAACGSSRSPESDSGVVDDARVDGGTAPGLRWSMVAHAGELDGVLNQEAVATAEGVLVVGGMNSGNPSGDVQRFDPSSRSWRTLGTLRPVATANHTVTDLRDGTFLVTAGGVSPISWGTRWLAGAETYLLRVDGIATEGPPMAEGRVHATDATLRDGRVLVLGGAMHVGEPPDTLPQALATAELFDPATSTWSSTGSMGRARYLHTSTLLPDGRVLVIGGTDESGAALAEAELYDPGSGTWSPAGSMAVGRWLHVACGLGDGRVLVAGGEASDGPTATAEVFTGEGFETVSELPVPAAWAACVSLDGGRVLLAGGYTNAERDATPQTVIFDGSSSSWIEAEPLRHARYGHSLVQLADGRVAAVMGMNRFDRVSSAELSEGAP